MMSFADEYPNIGKVVDILNIGHYSIYNGVQAVCKHVEYPEEILPSYSIDGTAPDLDRFCMEWLKKQRPLTENNNG